jgi:hypothetical protein
MAAANNSANGAFLLSPTLLLHVPPYWPSRRSTVARHAPFHPAGDFVADHVPKARVRPSLSTSVHVPVTVSDEDLASTVHVPMKVRPLLLVAIHELAVS